VCLTRFLALFAAWAGSLQLHAVEMNGGYDTTEPTASDIANWGTGWNPSDPGAPTFYSGWDYVGNVNAASGVYLGDGWVLTADHVAGGSVATPGATAFTMTVGSTTTTYDNTGVYDYLSNPAGSDEQNPVDLVLFQVSSLTSPLPALPPLTLATSAPADYLNSGTGDTVAMIGYGGGSGRTWGVDTVTLSSQYTPISLTENGPPLWFSTDFYTANGSFSKSATSTQTNDSQLVSGDSGGGDFIYNSTTKTWELAGINDGTGTTYVAQDPVTGEWEQVDQGTAGAIELDLSAYVQISDYASQIEADMAPEPPGWILLAGGLVSFGTARWMRKRLSL
jgi:hypothetical protein